MTLAEQNPVRPDENRLGYRFLERHCPWGCGDIFTDLYVEDTRGKDYYRIDDILTEKIGKHKAVCPALKGTGHEFRSS